MQKKIKVCEHSLCTLYDLYCLRELARAQSKQEKQTWRLYSDHFILFSEEQAHSLLCVKTFVFQCIKGSTIGKHPAFLGLFVWINKDREPSQTQRMHSQPENCDCMV